MKKTTVDAIRTYRRCKFGLLGIPILSVILVIFAIIEFIHPYHYWWVGLILIGLAAFSMILFVISLAYYNSRIRELEAEEILEEEEKRKKYERIRELEEALEEAKKED